MSRRNNRKGYRMLAYVLALVLLVTAVPVAVSQASDYIVPTTFVNKAADYKKQWDEQGNDGNTTLFIGDSFMSPQIWRNFYDTYQGKDVLRAQMILRAQKLQEPVHKMQLQYAAD